jgi:hypothetical protein
LGRTLGVRTPVQCTSENPIQTGRTTRGVERIGDTIRRPTGPRSVFVHTLLRYLEARAFSGAPKWLGIDSSGREILSYMPGDVPPELKAFSTAQVTGAAHLLRALHDSTVDFEGRGSHEVVCHGDASPCNCVFRDGLPYAFIDFDAAHAGERRDDVGYAAWLWLDLGNEDLDPAEQGRRVGEFVAAYGGMDLADAIPAVVDAQTELSRRDGAPLSTKEWARHCLQWSNENREPLAAGLALVRHAAL